jgi:hypothetical protein
MVKISYVLVNVWPVDGSVAVLYSGKVFEAVFMSRAFTVSGLNIGSFWSISATAPETVGAAMLVPLRVMYCAPEFAAAP